MNTKDIWHGGTSIMIDRREFSLRLISVAALPSALVLAGNVSAQSLKTQADWMWCNKCGVLFYAAHEGRSVCPVGGRHARSRGAMVYALMQDVSGYEQSGWQWCSKCQGLYFGPGRQYGACPAGGLHGGAPSSNYTVLHGSTQGVNTGGATIQPDWKWCVGCQGLFYPGNQAANRCAKGGRHDGRKSGRYFMASVR